jgi:hypothetical protein
MDSKEDKRVKKKECLRGKWLASRVQQEGYN